METQLMSYVFSREAKAIFQVRELEVLFVTYHNSS